MSNLPYAKLEAIFNTFNESLITFYSDLIDVAPEQKAEMSAELKQMMDISNARFKSVCDVAFREWYAATK